MKIELEGDIEDFESYNVGTDVNKFLSKVKTYLGNTLNMVVVKESEEYRLILKKKD